MPPSLAQLLHLRQVAGEDRLAQRLDRFGARKAAPPREGDAPHRHRPRERQYADQVARAARADGSRRQHGDAYAARDHLADRLERSALHGAGDRTALAQPHGVADLEHLVAEAMAFAKEQEALAREFVRGHALLAFPRMTLGHRDEEWLVVHRAYLDARLMERQRDQDHVHFPALQRLGEPVREVLLDVQLHGPRRAAQDRCQLWQPGGADGVDLAWGE